MRNKYFKLLAVFLCLVFIPMSASADLRDKLSFGPTLSFGLGKIGSANLSDALDATNSADVEIKTFDVSNEFGFAYKLGAFVEYNLVSDLFIHAELIYKSHSATIGIERMEDDTETGLSYRDIISSKASINFGSLLIPLYAKYKIKRGNYNVSLIGGFTFNFISEPSIESTEDIIEEEYDGSGNLINTTSTTLQYNSNITQYKSTLMDFTIGAGVEFPVGKGAFEIVIQYNIPMTKSDFYLTDIGFENNTENNSVFTYNEQFQLLQDTGIEINDFKASTLSISISYHIW